MSHWRDEVGYGTTDREASFRRYVGRNPEGEFTTPEEIKRAREHLFPPKGEKKVRTEAEIAEADARHRAGRADFI